MDSYDKVYRTIDRLAQEMPGRIGKDFGTWGEVFDAPTVMTLHRFLRSDVLRSLDYPVSTGKEANVFKATMGDGEDAAVKVYRVHTGTFRTMSKYIEGDPRFRHVPRGDHRALIHAWARKEFRNLERFRDAGVDVPIPYKALNNCIIMEYLSREDGPARSMKEEPPADPAGVFEKLWDDYKRILSKSRCVHADFSEYNVLMARGQPRVIDVGQAFLDVHPMALEFLERDVRNFTKYFRRFDVDAADEADRLAEARDIVRANEGVEIELEEF
jgi:RIO kinase 1